nr:hypothetical protein [Tanacetum cinerariifolium]
MTPKNKKPRSATNNPIVGNVRKIAAADDVLNFRFQKVVDFASTLFNSGAHETIWSHEQVEDKYSKQKTPARSKHNNDPNNQVDNSTSGKEQVAIIVP